MHMHTARMQKIRGTMHEKGSSRVVKNGKQTTTQKSKLKYGFIFTHSTGTRFVLCLRKGFYLWKRAFSKILRSAEWSKDASRYSKTKQQQQKRWKIVYSRKETNVSETKKKNKINNINSGKQNKYRFIRAYICNTYTERVQFEKRKSIAISTFTYGVSCVS